MLMIIYDYDKQPAAAIVIVMVAFSSVLLLHLR